MAEIVWTQKAVIARAGEELRPVLNGWLDAVEEYCECWNWEDVCWNHGERAAVSILSNAITKLGGVCIQEYKTPKKKDRSDPECAGYCDLAFSVQLKGKRVAYDVEAKGENFALHQPSVDIGKAESAMKEAVRCAQELDHSHRKLAAVFLNLTVWNEDQQKDLPGLIGGVNGFFFRAGSKLV